MWLTEWGAAMGVLLLTVQLTIERDVEWVVLV